MTKNLAVDAGSNGTSIQWKRAMRAVREPALEADPRMTEPIKWNTSTFEYQGNIFSFNPTKKLGKIAS